MKHELDKGLTNGMHLGINVLAMLLKWEAKFTLTPGAQGVIKDTPGAQGVIKNTPRAPWVMKN